MRQSFARLTAIALMMGASLFTTESPAFKPNRHTYGHTMITETVTSLTGYTYGSGFKVAAWKTALSDGTLVGFTPAAQAQVVLGVQAVDFIDGETYNSDGVMGWVYGEINVPEAHCDDDQTSNCSRRIINIKNSTVPQSIHQFVDGGDKFQLVNARLMLGRALHTLQDFYAHSNYSDTHMGGPFFAALSTDPTALVSAGPGSSSATCAVRNEPLLNSTWEDNGGNYALTPYGSGSSVITSGYFSNAYSLAGYASAPDGAGARCDHGMERFGATVSGINKDAPYSPFAPAPFIADFSLDEFPSIAAAATAASPLHVQASYHAASHTAKFLTEVVEALRATETDPVKQDNLVAALLGVNLGSPVIGFVIDHTGSMGDIIDGVKSNIEKTISDAATANPDAQFLVESYGDPDIGTPLIGSAADAEAAVSALYASGGGDCPELTQGGLLAALYAAPPKSKLLVYTDASSKDADLAPQVKQLALDKQIVVDYSVSGSCSPIDPTYYDIAAATGGQVLVTEHDSASVEASFIGISIDPPGYASRPVVVEGGTLTAGRTIDIPVDSTTTSLAVIGTFADGTLSLYDPSGTLIDTTTTDAIITDFLGGRGFSIKTPAVGTWRAVLDGASGAYSINANATSTFDIVSTSFFAASATGRAGHEANLPFLNGPPPGTLKMEARMTEGSGVSLTEVDLVAADDTVLATASLASLGNDIYSGSVVVPDAAFRVRVSGADAAGKAFARVTPTLATPRHFDFTLPDYPTWVPGQTQTLRLLLTNYGSDDTFAISGNLNGVLAVPSAPSTAVTAGAMATIDLQLAVPAGTAAPSTQTLQLTVASTSASETRSLPLQIKADSDGDGVPDDEESGPTGSDPDYDGNGDGIPDRLQATVISLHSRQGLAYLTASINGPGTFASAGTSNVPAGADASVAAGFPIELLAYKIVGLPVGGATQVVVGLPAYLGGTGYQIYASPTPAATDAPLDFTSNGATGAASSTNTVTISYVDGQRGDADGLADGQISTLGGPTGVDILGVDHEKVGNAASPPDDGTITTTSDGGGCTVGRGASDASLPLLLAGAMLGLWRQRRRIATRAGQGKDVAT